MNKTFPEGLALFNEIQHLLEHSRADSAVLKIIAPPFIHLHAFLQALKKGSDIFIAAQNCHHEPSGAYTGEVAAAMIKSIGASYLLIGHSERRMYFAETDAQLLKKIRLAFENELNPIFCIGETLVERESKVHFERIEKQLEEVLFHFQEKEIQRVIIAYEPIWAIGTGQTATTEQAQEMHAFIRSVLSKKYGNQVAQSISLLYGGSCNSINAKELFACEDVDGGLIGGASLKAEEFVKIIHSF